MRISDVSSDVGSSDLLFYGKNATAGVISINTANPTSTFQARTRVSYEFNAKQPSVEGFVSGPVTDTLALRLAGRWSKMYGGLVKNAAGTTSFSTNDVATGILTPTTAAPGFSDVPGERELITRFTAVWEPFDGFKQTFKASVNSNHTNNPAWNGVIAACATGKSFLDRVTPCKRDFVIRQNKMPVNLAASFPLADKDGGTFNSYDSYKARKSTSELQSLMRISYAVFCLKKKKDNILTQ